MSAERSNQSSKSAIFTAIRQALQHPSHVIDPGRPINATSAKPRAVPSDLSQRFVDEVTRLGAGCYVATSGREANDYILDLISKRKLTRIALSNSAVVNEIDVADALKVAGLKAQIINFDNLGAQVLSERKQSIRDNLLHAEVGITGVSYGIADTGTLVIGADREYNRLASLLPAVHLAIVRSDQLMPNLQSTLERISTSGQLNQAITLITGPSRTADIELTLTIGVHGPKELQVVLLKS